MSRKNRGSAEAGVVVFLITIGLLVYVYILGGIFRTDVTWTVPTPAASGVPKGPETSFEVSLTARHWLGGCVKGQQADVNKAISEHLRPGDCVKNVSVSVRHSFVDNLLLGVTLAIYTPVTVDVKGTIIQAGPPSP